MISEAISLPSDTIFGPRADMLKGMIAQLVIGGGLALALVFILLSTLDTRSK